MISQRGWHFPHNIKLGSSIDVPIDAPVTVRKDTTYHTTDVSHDIVQIEREGVARIEGRSGDVALLQTHTQIGYFAHCQLRLRKQSMQR